MPQFPPPVDVSGGRHVTYINPCDYAHLIPASWEACRPLPSAKPEPHVYDISADETIQRLEGGPGLCLGLQRLLQRVRHPGISHRCGGAAGEAPPLRVGGRVSDCLWQALNSKGA